MQYINNSQKFTAVLNSSIPIPRLLNALAHTTAGLAADLGVSVVRYLEYKNDSDGFCSRIAEAPFIILKARNSGQLSSLRAKAEAAAVRHNTFASSMIGSSAHEQIEQTRTAIGLDLEYWVIVLYGNSDVINPLTKKFSLFNADISK